jgi:hypothetical protein
MSVSGCAGLHKPLVAFRSPSRTLLRPQLHAPPLVWPSRQRATAVCASPRSAAGRVRVTQKRRRPRRRRSKCRFDTSRARFDLHGGQVGRGGARPTVVGCGNLAAELARSAPRDCPRTGRSRPLRVGPRFDLHGKQGGHGSPGCDSLMAARSPSSPIRLCGGGGHGGLMVAIAARRRSRRDLTAGALP